jgi:GntR family carbon starvation induced transcriptional regulator
MGDEKSKADIRDLAAEAGSLTESAYRNIRADIIAGRLPPGTKLQIDDLKSRYGLSASPLREGLARLISQGFVSAESQRGFRVAAMSAEDLADITLARQVVEPAALKLAIARGDRYVARMEGQTLENFTEFSDLHKGFHVALIAACGSPRLLDEQSRLYDQAERYRQGMMQNFMVIGHGVLMREHKQLMDMVLARDADGACTSLQHHLGHTYEFCYGEDAAANARQTAPP